MKIEPGQKYFLWDGECGFCFDCVQILKRIAPDPEMHIAPYQSFTADELAKVGLTPHMCDRELQAVTPEGRTFGGAFAINYYVNASLPWSILIKVLYALPPLVLMEVVGYRVVALNRGFFSKLTGMKSCSIDRPVGDQPVGDQPVGDQPVGDQPVGQTKDS